MENAKTTTQMSKMSRMKSWRETKITTKQFKQKTKTLKMAIEMPTHSKSKEPWKRRGLLRAPNLGSREVGRIRLFRRWTITATTHLRYQTLGTKPPWKPLMIISLIWGNLSGFVFCNRPQLWGFQSAIASNHRNSVSIMGHRKKKPRESIEQIMRWLRH